MTYLSLLDQLKISSPEEIQLFARSYDVELSLDEIITLQPLLEHIQIHWLFTGIPNHFLNKVEDQVGIARTADFLQLFDLFRGRLS